MTICVDRPIDGERCSKLTSVVLADNKLASGYLRYGLTIHCFKVVIPLADGEPTELTGNPGITAKSYNSPVLAVVALHFKPIQFPFHVALL